MNYTKITLYETAEIDLDNLKLLINYRKAVARSLLITEDSVEIKMLTEVIEEVNKTIISYLGL